MTEISLITVLMLAAALLTLGLAVHVWPRRRTREGRDFLLVMAAATVYALASLAALIAPDAGAKLFWVQVSYLGLAVLAPLWWVCVMGLTGQTLVWTIPRLAVAWGVPALALILVWTNAWHGWMWPSMEMLGEGPNARLVFQTGPGVWLLAVQAYGLCLHAFLLLLRAAHRADQQRRRGWLLLALASIFPFAGNVISVLGRSPWPGIDLTPLGLVFTAVAALWAQFRTPLFEPQPVAEHALFDSLTDLVVVLNCDGKILALNPAARRKLGLGADVAGRPLVEAHPDLWALVEKMPQSCDQAGGTSQWELGAGAARHVFDVRTSALRTPSDGHREGRVYGRVLTAREVTRERQALDAAARRARQMELLNAITRAALDGASPAYMYQTFAERMMELFAADGTYLTLWQEGRNSRSQAAAAAGIFKPIFPSCTVIGRDGLPLTQYLLEAGQPLLVEDLNSSGLVDAGAAALIPARSGLALPLVSGGQKLGAVIVGFEQPRKFSAEEVALGEQAAAVIAVGMAKARLAEAGRWRLAELTALQSISAAVAASLDLQHTFDTAARLLKETFGYGLVSIYRLQGATLHLGAQVGYSDDRIFTELDIHRGVLGRSVRTRTTQFVSDVTIDPDFLPANDSVACEICAPLLLEDRVVGVLNVENPCERPFSEDDVRLLQTFANHMAVAIVNAELYAGERSQRELAEALREAGQALTETLNLDELLDRMLDSIRRVVPYDAACFMILDDTGQKARSARRTGFYQFGPEVDAQMRSLVLDLSEASNLSAMATSGKPMVIPDTDEYPHWLKLATWPYVHSWAGAPVMAAGKTVGFVSLYMCQAGFYRPEHLQPLTSFAAQAGSAIQNVRLFDELREQVRREQSLFAATRDFTSRLGEAAVQDAITRHMTEVLQASGCTISRWEPESDRLVVERDYATDTQLKSDEEGAAYRLSEYPATRRVLDTHEPAHLSLSDPNIEANERSLLEQLGAGTVLILPLVAGRDSTAYGVVELYRLPGARRFSDSELELAHNLAAQASQAIENARLFAEVQRLAVMDELTGLYNRRGFFDLGRREHERATRYHHALSAIFVDIDHFKLFNDAFSYAVGDQALRLVAQCLRETTRETDLIGRYGGEEFVALLPETDLKAALRVAERVRSAVGRLRVKTGWGDVNLTVSIGVHQSDEQTPTLDHLVDCAGQSLHAAKESGRNRVIAA